jgi:hypothetical protein
MTPETLSSLMTEESFAALRGHPEFRDATQRAAAQSVRHFQSLDASYQWITKDIGRAAICLTALALHLMNRLTVQTLTAASLDNSISSAGRVQQVVRRCQDIGEMTVEEGAGLWTRRPMRVGEGLIRALRERALIDLKAMLPLAPDLEGAAELANTDEGFVTYALCIGAITNQRRDLFDFPPPVDFFLDREAGMLILLDLMAAQQPGRTRQLEEAPISRYALSRRYGVSRAHINKILAESGQIDCAQSDRVVFSQALSAAMERHFAVVFQLNHCAAQALTSGWRFDRPRNRV